MSFIKPLFALILAAFVGATVVACDSGSEETGESDAA
jgi:hypothetical protein